MNHKTELETFFFKIVGIDAAPVRCKFNHDYSLRASIHIQIKTVLMPVVDVTCFFFKLMQ